jgi:hypothetical protein
MVIPSWRKRNTRPTSQVWFFFRFASAVLLKRFRSPSGESDEARITHTRYFRYDPRGGNTAEQYGSKRVPNCHRRCSPDIGRIHRATRGAVCDRYVFNNFRLGDAGLRIHQTEPEKHNMSGKIRYARLLLRIRMQKRTCRL